MKNDFHRLFILICLLLLKNFVSLKKNNYIKKNSLIPIVSASFKEADFQILGSAQKIFFKTFGCCKI